MYKCPGRLTNYANPGYCVATRFADYAGGIRVSFMQPRLFQFDMKCSARGIYHTDLYFRVCTIWDAQSFKLTNYCGFNIQPSCSDMCGDHRRPQTLAEMCRNMGICYGFRSVAARVKYPGFIYLLRNTFVTTAPKHFRRSDRGPVLLS